MTRATISPTVVVVKHSRSVAAELARPNCRSAGVSSTFIYLSLRCSIWFLLSASLVQAQAKDALSIQDVLALLEARDAAARTIAATFVISDGPASADELEAFDKARYKAAQQFAKVTGETLPPYKSRAKSIAPRQTTYRYFARNAQGDTRYEILLSSPRDDKNVVAVTVCDKTECRSYVKKQGLIHGLESAELLSQYLGLGFQWTGSEATTTFRSVHEVLKEAHRGHKVTLDSDANDDGMVTLVARHAVANEKLRKSGTFLQHTFWFAPKFAMAPVKFEAKMVYRGEDGTFRDTVPDSRSIGQWSEYRLVNGVWMPYKYVFRTMDSVPFPKEGDHYPRGFNLETPRREDFREESFCTTDKDVTVVDLAVNEEISEEQFSLDFPKGTSVYNRLTDKLYQVGNAGELVEQSISAAYKKTKTHQSAWRIFFIVVNGVVLAGIVVFMVARRARKRLSAD